MHILCMCSFGLNRSKFCAMLLSLYGYTTQYAGINAQAPNPVSCAHLHNAQHIICMRPPIYEAFTQQYTTKKPVTILDINDNYKRYDTQAQHIAQQNIWHFQYRYVYTQIWEQVQQFVLSTPVYRQWKHPTSQELAYIKSVEIAVSFLLYHHKDLIRTILVKGSFVRREMNKKSDIDVVVILKHNKDIMMLQQWVQTYKELFNPVEFSIYSLYEIQRNKKSKQRNDKKLTSPHTNDQLQHIMHIWGKHLYVTTYPKRSAQQRYRGLQHAFIKDFIPLYYKGEFTFSSFVKCVLWLAEYEQQTQGKQPSATWQQLATTLPKNHIGKLAYEYRMHPVKDVAIKHAFVKKVESYLSSSFDKQE
ncbi:MAG: nucleotidyltransferase domain-containing protein [Candidatus Woesearchaeota archaeon]